VYHSRIICQQTSFLTIAISKYWHWRGWT